MVDLIIWAISGLASGIIFGIIPGAGPFVAVAAAYPFLSAADPGNIMMFYVAVLIASNYANSVTAILYGIPGDATAISTARTGHKFFKRGFGNVAIASNAFNSTVGVVFATLFFILLLPSITSIFGFYNSVLQTIIIFITVILITVMTKQKWWLNIALLGFGLLLSKIGIDQTTHESFGTFGIAYLTLGLPFSAIMIGLYIVPEMLRNLKVPVSNQMHIGKPVVYRNTWFAGLLGSFIGFWSGLIPGITNILGSYVSAITVQKFFKRPYLKSIAAAEAANNSGALSSLLPLLILAIPITGSEFLIYYLMLEQGHTFSITSTVESFQWVLYLILPVAGLCLLIHWLGFNILRVMARLYIKHRLVFNVTILLLVSFFSIMIYPMKGYYLICVLMLSVLGFSLRRFDTVPILYGYFLGELFLSSFERSLIIIL